MSKSKTPKKKKVKPLPLSVRISEGYFLDEPAQTFTRYTISEFPALKAKQRFDVHREDAFGQFDGPANTTLLHMEEIRGIPYKRYWVEHETWIKQLARIKGETITKIKKLVRFNAFVNTIDPTRVWIQIKKQYGEEMLRRIRREQLNNMTAYRHELDVLRLVDALKGEQDTIYGAWFIKLRIPKVTTAMLQGIDVNESEDFIRYLAAGDLASLELIREVAGEPIKVIVTKRGTIVFRRRLAQRLALEVLDEVAELIEPYSSATSVNWAGRR